MVQKQASTCDDESSCTIPVGRYVAARLSRYYSPMPGSPVYRTTDIFLQFKSKLPWKRYTVRSYARQLRRFLGRPAWQSRTERAKRSSFDFASLLLFFSVFIFSLVSFFSDRGSVTRTKNGSKNLTVEFLRLVIVVMRAFDISLLNT